MTHLLPSFAGVLLVACGVVACGSGVADIAPATTDDGVELARAEGPTLVRFEAPTTVSIPALDGPLYQAQRFTWKAVDGANWQIASDEVEDPRVTDAREGTRGECPAGMVHVKGKMKVDADMEKKQLEACTSWISREYPERCASFDREAWLELSADMPVEEKDYCIDRFEYPNVVGQYPVVFTSANESAAMCAAEGKRLCGEDEWTFACEGEEAQPYPNGYTRDANACTIDHDWRAYEEGSIDTARGGAAAVAMDRLWQGRPAGASQCKSSFGVYDLTGNVDEWTTSASASGNAKVQKGGYWGPVRARCRPSTRSHGEHHKYYQQGFRCCADAPRTPTA